MVRYLVCCALAVWFIGCSKDDHVGEHHEQASQAKHTKGVVEPDHGAHEDHKNHTSMSADKPSEHSLFLLDSTWTDADGKSLKLGVVRGHPTLVLMFYGTCEAVCPILIEDMKKIDASLSERARAQTRKLLVTFDPDNDTTDKLAALAKKRGVASPDWHLLRGDDSQVRELAAVLGVRYRKTGNGEFSHSNLITLLDEQGVVAHQVEGVGLAPEPMTERIEAMLRPSV